jgi:hypothetical protein
MGLESKKVKRNTKSFTEFKYYYYAMTAVTYADFAALPLGRIYERIRVHLTEAVVEYLLIENNRLFFHLQMGFFGENRSLGNEYEYSLFGFLVFHHFNAALFKERQSKGANFDWIEKLYQMILQKLNGPWYETQLSDCPHDKIGSVVWAWYEAVFLYAGGGRRYPMGVIIESIVLGDEQRVVSPSPFFVVLFALRNIQEPLFGLKHPETFKQLFLSETLKKGVVTRLLSVVEGNGDQLKLFKRKMSEVLRAFTVSEKIEDQAVKASIHAMQRNNGFCLAFQILQYGRRSQEVHATTKSYQQFLLFASDGSEHAKTESGLAPRPPNQPPSTSYSL